MNTQGKVNKRLFKKTELATHKVELGLQEDMSKLINDTDDMGQNINKIGDAAEKALSIANSSSKNITSLSSKIDKKLSEVQSSAKELGVEPKNVKGYDKLNQKIQVLKNYDSYVQRSIKNLRGLTLS
tara:strand:+ start:440 stop:820 length:381 start_codon:yes stop_codon:yes gene_type:complete